MIQEAFNFYKPCKLLQPYVRYYWVFSSNQMPNTYTFPIGCPQIIFHKRTPLYIPELGTTQSKLTISGQVNFSSHLQADDDIEMIVVVFHPHTINMFLYGTGATGIPEQSWGVTTCKDRILYLHLVEPLDGVEAISLPIGSCLQELGKVRSVKTLKNNTPLKYKVSGDRLVIDLNETPSDIDYVIKVEF